MRSRSVPDLIKISLDRTTEPGALNFLFPKAFRFIIESLVRCLSLRSNAKSDIVSLTSKSKRYEILSPKGYSPSKAHSACTSMPIAKSLTSAQFRKIDDKGTTDDFGPEFFDQFDPGFGGSTCRQ